MQTQTATLEQLSASSITTTVLKLTPVLLAGGRAVAGSPKAHRIGSLSGDPSLASPASSKGRGGVQDPAQSGAAGGATTTSPGGKSGAEAAAGGTTARNSTGGDSELATDPANASSSSDATKASSSSDGVDGVGPNAGDSAGGDQAAAMTGGGAASPSRPGTAAGRAGAATAGAGGRGAPGSPAGGNEASSLSPDRASASQQGAGAGDASDGDNGAADLSSCRSVAALEASAAGAAGARTSVPARRQGAGKASGSGDDGSGTGGVAAAGVEGGSRIGAIDVPSGKVKVDEEYRPQTLGGVLPLVLGVNEEGRFDFDQYSLRPEVKRILDELAEKLKTAEYDRLDIIGYTDRIGTTDYNRRLSELRAYAVAQYLVGRGVPENKIRYEGRGDKDPLTPAGNCRGLAREELITCLQNDRRVEIEASIHRKHATVIQ